MTKTYTVVQPFRRCQAVRPGARGGQRCIHRYGHDGPHTAWVKDNPLKVQLVQFLVDPEREGNGGGGML